MKTFYTAGAVVLSCLLTGCGARVLTTTGAGGTTINSATVFSGTTLTLNAQAGQLCIDAASAGTCKTQETQQ